MSTARCLTNGGCGWSQPAADCHAALHALNDHFDTEHLGRQHEVTQLDGVTWRDQFLAAVRAVPVGETFTTAELHGRIPDPPHHNHWGAATSEAAHLGLIQLVTAQQSVLPSTKRSLVARWRRVEPKRTEVAA